MFTEFANVTPYLAIPVFSLKACYVVFITILQANNDNFSLYSDFPQARMGSQTFVLDLLVRETMIIMYKAKAVASWRGLNDFLVNMYSKVFTAQDTL